MHTDTAAGEGRIRLLLVDDHPTSREPLAMLLERQPDLTVVGQAGSLAEARAFLASGTPVDVALVDLYLPDGHGADLVRDLRQRDPEALALVVTGSGDRRDHARAVAAGAAAVLSKSVPIAELVTAIRRLCAGEALLSVGEAVDLMRLLAEEQERDRAAAAAFARLTPREREILAALAEGLGNEAIGERLHISPETVRFHVRGLLGKLGVESRLHAVLLALRHGVVPPP